MSSLIQPLVNIVRDYGINGCEAKAQALAIGKVKIANIGGGRDSPRWSSAEFVDALKTPDLDFNTCKLPFKDNTFDLVVCEQVIEHLHNTTFFLEELYRITKEDGYLILSTENLASLPNLFALLCQRAPFSTQAVCGKFIGGWKDGDAGYGIDHVKTNHSTFSGVKGHVRVMTTGQVKILLKLSGFKLLSKYGFGFNHYILFYAQKIVQDLAR